ncbi:hypothetical protein D3C85_1583210 [compost metagenome]
MRRFLQAMKMMKEAAIVSRAMQASIQFRRLLPADSALTGVKFVPSLSVVAFEILTVAIPRITRLALSPGMSAATRTVYSPAGKVMVAEC